jgi:hypothetical protein
VTDAILVRAPVGLVYRTLTDVTGWSDWWPGRRTMPLAAVEAVGAVDSVDAQSASASSDAYALELRVGRRPLRMTMTVHGWRHDLGMFVDVTGAVELRTEWWLETRPDGAIVHHLVHGPLDGAASARRSRRDRSAQDRYLRSVATGMQSLKDRLELTVMVALGRVP